MFLERSGTYHQLHHHWHDFIMFFEIFANHLLSDEAHNAKYPAI